MFHRQATILVAAFLLLLAPPFGPPEASAGQVLYEWGPIVGYGYVVTYPENQFIDFTTRNGGLTIGYDPDDLMDSFIAFSTGSPGYDVIARDITVSGDTFTAMYQNGGTITVSIDGDPGPLDGNGDPVSLSPLLRDLASVDVTPSYHGLQLTFSGAQVAVPEPTSLLTLALGIGWVAASSAARRGETAGPSRARRPPRIPAGTPWPR